MSRRETALVCVTAVAAMLLLWWAADLPAGWVAWAVRVAAVAAVPAVFFGVIAAQLVRSAPEQPSEEARRAAYDRVRRDVAPLLSRPERLLRPVERRRPR